MKSATLSRSFIALAAGLLLTGIAQAMTELANHELGHVTGEGLMLPLQDIRVTTHPNSFLELTGAAVTGTTLKRGDVRYYGLSLSRGATHNDATHADATYNGNTYNWTGGSCTGGTYGLGCPLSSDGIVNLSTFDNPFLQRTYNYPLLGPAGTVLTDQTVLEFLWPSNSDPYRFAFWGEIEAGRSGVTPGDILKSQSIIVGRAASRLKPPSIYGTDWFANPYQGITMRLFQNRADGSLGMTNAIRIAGNYRFSVNQTALSNTAPHEVPTFTDMEGLYFRNVNSYLPLGQLHYQSLIMDDTQPGSSGSSTSNGNFVVELTRVPDIAALYNDYYSFNPRCATLFPIPCGYDRGNANGTEPYPDRYYETHGYVEWGSKFPVNPENNGYGGSGEHSVRYAGTGGSTRDQVLAEGGIAFASRAAGQTWVVHDNQNNTGSTQRNVEAVSLGSARVEGMLINHLRVVTRGAN